MPLDQLFSSLSNSSGESSLGQLLKAPSTQGALSGAASGAVVSMLMNKKARKKMGKTAVKVGGAAALAGLGYYAYRQWQNSQAAPGVNPSQQQAAPALPANAQSPPPLPANWEAASTEVAVTDSLQVKMILSMIAAAAADGTIDREEMNVLIAAIDEAPLEPAEKSELTSALNQPPAVEDLAALVESPEEAAELYGAALTAIDADTPAEDLFLMRFARALELEPGLVEQLNAAMEA